jgi:hypothetical protein
MEVIGAHSSEYTIEMPTALSFLSIVTQIWLLKRAEIVAKPQNCQFHSINNSINVSTRLVEEPQSEQIMSLRHSAAHKGSAFITSSIHENSLCIHSQLLFVD